MISTVSQYEQIESTLSHLLEHPGTLWEAARYAVLGGGKRLRPLLTLVTAETLGADIEKALYPAAAIELIHAYSLIHDDLPCMDDDDLRRGRPTLHRAFDEATAVLVGDLLLTYAFEVIASAPGIDDSTKISLSKTLAAAAGGKEQGLIQGQHLDLVSSGTISNLKEVEAIHRGKTAALIGASVAFGGIITGVAPAPLIAFGRHLGLAFQIIDDVLDVTQSEEKHGRPTDIELDKATYVKHLGVDGARLAAEQELAQALNAIEKLPVNTDPLKKLAFKFVHRSK